MSYHRLLLVFLLFFELNTIGQTSSLSLANLQQDVGVQQYKINELTILVGELQHQVNQLNQLLQTQQTYIMQLEQSIAVQSKQLQNETSKKIEVLAEEVSRSIQRVEKQSHIQSAVSVSKQFSDNYPKTGISYTVVAGDSLSSVAKKNNASVKDIENANKIANPDDLRVGQVLFIPQRQ